MTRPVFFAAFFWLSALYALLIFPFHLESLPLRDLLWLVNNGGNLSAAYLPLDSAAYLDVAKQPLSTIAHNALPTMGITAGLFSNVLVYVVGKVAYVVEPSRPLLVVALINQGLFAWAIVHYRAVCRAYGISFERFLPLVLANPLVLFAMYTLNKEALGIFLIAALLRYSTEKKTGRFWIVAILCLFTRNVFFLFALLLLLRSPLRRASLGWLLVASSLLFPLVLWATHDAPLGDQFGRLDSLTLAFKQQTASTLVWAHHLTQIPFGYLVAYPVVTTVNVLSPAFNPRYYASYEHGVNWGQIALQASAWMFLALLVGTARHAGLRSALRIEPLRLVFAVTLFTSVYPLSQHRYLLPLYPLIVLAFLIARERRLREETRNRAPGFARLGELVAS